MIRMRLAALTLTVAAFATVALVGEETPKTSAGRMQQAATKFLAAATPEVKAKAAFAFDDPQRLKWFFTPQQDKEKKSTRKGARLEEMSAEQRAAALALLKSGLSEKSFETASTIMGLEQLLAELEAGKGQFTRNPTWYFVSVFGEPSATGKWGWRFEGHHLSVNYTLNKGEVVSATPLLLASNPAEVKDGPKKGLRPLPGTEDHARALINSLSADQKKAAEQPKQFGEINEGDPKAGVGAPVGVTADKLTAEQKATLQKLLDAYTERMPDDLAAVETKRAKGTAADKMFFAYWGSTEPGKPYTYRVYAPEFVVEFLNVQADAAKNPANHIHSTWRRLPDDFAVSE